MIFNHQSGGGGSQLMSVALHVTGFPLGFPATLYYCSPSDGGLEVPLQDGKTYECVKDSVIYVDVGTEASFSITEGLQKLASFSFDLLCQVQNDATITLTSHGPY